MVSAIATFEKDYTELIEFISRSSDIDKLFSRLKCMGCPKIKEEAIIEEYLRNRTAQKSYIYKLFIIILYGALEQYVEDVIKEYTSSCCDICSEYENLPEKIKNEHSKLAISLAGKLSYSKYSHIKIEDIVRALNQGLNDNIAVVVPESFLQNGGNYRHEEICRMFHNLDIDINSCLHQYEPLASNLLSKYNDDKHSDLFYNNRINRVVTERNTIAHGGHQGINLLDITEMLETAEDVRSYVLTLNNLLTDSKNELLYNFKQTVEFDSDELYKNDSVIIPELNGVSISIGDKIIAKRSGKVYPQYNLHSIKNIQIDGRDVKFVSCNRIREIGIKLDPPTKKNCRYKFLIHCPPLKLLHS